MLHLIALLAAVPSLTAIEAPVQIGRIAEWSIDGLPTPARPFDPNDWTIQATVQRPGAPAATIHAFWYAPYSRGKGPDGKELFVASGHPGWRLRFTPMASGRHTLTWRAFRDGRPAGPAASVRFDVKPGALKGFVRISRENPEYLAYADGSRFLPIGMNTAWWNEGGTRDYERWAARMRQAGMNYGRLWMAPWSFGIEAAPGQLGNYAMDRAWALDHVLRTLLSQGVQVVLCLDYHGMLQQTADFWGSNDFWRLNPYNAAIGGPAKTQNDFFINPEAKRLYRQRLRYVAARYAAYPNIAVWEFWNEIDNVRQHFKDQDMVAWHGEMAREVRRLDPYGRLVSTSLTHDILPNLWTEARLDLVQSHSYNQTNPGLDFAARAERFRKAYGKPYIVGEYGVDWRAAMSEIDPNNRGLRQAIWGSLVGGGAGTAQSWWWETLDARNAYPMYASLARFVGASPIGSRGWKPMRVESDATAFRLGGPLEGAQPFDVRIDLPLNWGEQNAGLIVATDSLAARGQAAALNGFLHGTAKRELRRPFRIQARFGERGEVGVRLNSVSQGAELVALVDGREAARKAFPDKDGKWESNNEYGEEFRVPVEPGVRTVEFCNDGPDWASLDWVEVRGALPSRGSGGSAVRAVASGLRDAAALWVLDPAFSYPANAKELKSRTVEGGTATLLGLADGPYRIRWYDTLAGRWMATTTARSTRGKLPIAVPPFRESVAALVDPAR